MRTYTCGTLSYWLSSSRYGVRQVLEHAAWSSISQNLVPESCTQDYMLRTYFACEPVASSCCTFIVNWTRTGCHSQQALPHHPHSHWMNAVYTIYDLHRGSHTQRIPIIPHAMLRATYHCSYLSTSKLHPVL